MTGGPPAPVFLDACVLYPPLLRCLLEGAAQSGLFRPLWSVRVLDEWLIAAARKQTPQAAEQAQEAARTLTTRFPAALCPPDAAREAQVALPDAADAHVVAAAAQAGAATILTFNLGDFPARVLAAQGLVARHPDGFLWELWSHHPQGLEAVLRACLPGLEPAGRRAPLKRARLPRLAKAQAGL